jgi:putative membrane protein
MSPGDLTTDEHEDTEDRTSDPRVDLAWERTHLATQRTVLSWIRTSIAFVIFGVALAKFGLFVQLFSARNGISTDSLPPGIPDPAVTDVIGIILVFAGVLHSLVALLHSRGPEGGPATFSRWKIWSVRISSAATFIAGLALLIYLISV